MSSIYYENIKKALKNSGKSQREVAKEIGIHEGSLSRQIQGRMDPTASVIKGLSKSLNVSADYLLGLEEQEFSSFEKIEIKKDISRLQDKFDRFGEFDVAPVPLLEDSIAAGAPVPISGRSEENRYFLKSWLRRFRSPVLIKVGRHQESMSPTILPGDLLLLDRRPVLHPKKNAIYALNAEEGGTIKRCSLSGGKLRLTPDNPDYSDKVIFIEDVDIRKIIVGRVVWIARELDDPDDEEEKSNDK